jgi:hypothetical protein
LCGNHKENRRKQDHQNRKKKVKPNPPQKNQKIAKKFFHDFKNTVFITILLFF